MHHLLLLVVLLGWVLFLVVSWEVALPLYVIAVIISLAIYFKIIKAQRQRPSIGKRAMVGDRAVVAKVERDQIEVDYQGETWRAVSSQPLQPGQQVVIEAINGLTLQVAPLLPNRRDEHTV